MISYCAAVRDCSMALVARKLYDGVPPKLPFVYVDLRDRVYPGGEPTCCVSRCCSAHSLVHVAVVLTRAGAESHWRPARELQGVDIRWRRRDLLMITARHARHLWTQRLLKERPPNKKTGEACQCISHMLHFTWTLGLAPPPARVTA